MAGDTDNPRIWEGADVYVAEAGSTGPEDVTNPWPDGWDALGLLSEDGLTESRDQDTTDHYAYGGILVRTTRSKHKRTFKVTCLEDNAVVFGLVNPGSTADTSDGLTTRAIKVPTTDPRAFGFEFRDGEITKRIVVSKGEVTEVGEVTYSDSEMAVYELTVNIYPDADGVLYYELTNDPAAAA